MAVGATFVGEEYCQRCACCRSDFEGAERQKDFPSQKIYGHSIFIAAESPVTHDREQFSFFEDFHHFQYAAHVAQWIDDTKGVRLSCVFKKMAVYVAFFAMDQEADRCIEYAQTLHGGLPAADVGGEQYDPPAFVDKFFDLCLIIEVDRHRLRPLDAYCSPVNEGLAEIFIHAEAMDQIFESVFLRKPSGDVEIGLFSYVRPEKGVIKGDTAQQAISGAAAAELYEGVKNIVLKV